MKTILLILIITIQTIYAADYYYKNNNKVTLTPINSIQRSNSNINYYQTQRGTILGITNKIIIKMKNNNNLEKYLEEFDLILEKIFINNAYLIRVKDKNNTLFISNRLSEKLDVIYAHPDFIKKRISR